MPPNQPVPISQQIAVLMNFLEKYESSVQDPKYPEVIEYVRKLPPPARPPELIRAVARAFKVDEDVVLDGVDPKRSKKDFDVLVPSSGWLYDYVKWTRETEPPTVFHFFAGATSLGAAMRRNVYVNQGSYKVFPNLCVIIVAPSGRCRKTSCCNLAVSLYRSTAGRVIADRTTPEALIDAFKECTDTVGIIYAPELAVFLGKQKYQEGMVPMLTRLFDCPDDWSSATVMRGEAHLYNVALSFLACSTMDWIQTAIPRDAFGGGFMSRLLFVVQEDTPRCFPRPPALDLAMQSSLVDRLRKLEKIRGEMKLDKSAEDWWDAWYRAQRGPSTDEKQFAGYYSRKPDHLLRMATILRASQCEDLIITADELKQSMKILDWVESFLPGAFGEMSQTSVGEEQHRMLRQMKKRGGALDHTTWLRLNSNRMNARQFREYIETLRAAGLLEWDQAAKHYLLTPEGWAR